MKKAVLSLLIGAAALGASAADYVVYNDGALGSGTTWYGWYNINVDFTAENPTNASEKVIRIKPDGGAGYNACSGGIFTNVDLGKFHSATLSFDWYAEGPGNYQIRLVAEGDCEQNYDITVTDENANRWNTLTLNVADVYPQVSNAWNLNLSDGKGYLFGVNMTNGNESTVFYAKNIVYTNLDESWVVPAEPTYVAPTTVPTPTQDPATVVSMYGSAYPQATSITFQQWGAPTKSADVTIDGKNVFRVVNFTYFGWELNPHLDVTDCNYMHVDYWTEDGTTFGFTPISPGQEKPWVASSVKQGEWNSYDVPLSHWDNVNYADVFQTKFDNGNNTKVGYITNVYFYKKDNGEPEQPTQPVTPGATWYGVENFNTTGSVVKPQVITLNYEFIANENNTLTCNFTTSDLSKLIGLVQLPNVKVNDVTYTVVANKLGSYTATSDVAYEAGAKLNVFFQFPYAEGQLMNTYSYVYGSSNEKPIASPALTAKVYDINPTSAEIEYSYTLPEELKDATCKVYLNDVEITENPYTISGLSELTAYNYTLKLVATLDGTEYTSNIVDLKFTTTTTSTTKYSFYGAENVNFTDYMFPGSEEKHNTENVKCYYTITYNPDKTLLVSLGIPVELADIVGLVAKFHITGAFVETLDNFKRCSVEVPDNVAKRAVVNNFDGYAYYEAQTTHKAEMQDELNLTAEFAYAGPGARFNIKCYEVGNTNDALAVEEVKMANNNTIDVYTMTGIRVLSGVDRNEALRLLNPGMYIVGGKKVIVK